MQATMSLLQARVAPSWASRAPAGPARRSVQLRATAETVEKPAAEAAPAPAAPKASTSAPSGARPSVVKPHKEVETSSFPDLLAVMSFNGLAPEIINGRLAMVGFVAAFGAELFTGKPALSQSAGHGGAVFWTFVLVSLASLAPIYRGVRNDEAFGPLTPDAELLNGRAAMVGFGMLVLLEAVKGHALF